jgi:predicted nucleic acid-binding protein
VPDAWDTSVASRVHVGERHSPLLTVHRQREVPIPLPAPAIQEVVRGLVAPSASREHARSKLRWFGRLFRDPLTEVIPFDGVAAELAGRLLARHPHPPRNRRRNGTRAQQRAAWALDVQIAACAFAGGYGVLTENVGDFSLLQDAIAEMLPSAPPLAVSDAKSNAQLER